MAPNHITEDGARERERKYGGEAHCPCPRPQSYAASLPRKADGWVEGRRWHGSANPNQPATNSGLSTLIPLVISDSTPKFSLLSTCMCLVTTNLHYSQYSMSLPLFSHLCLLSHSHKSVREYLFQFILNLAPGSLPDPIVA